MTLRDQRQMEFADAWIDKGKRGILNLCPRFGKIYTTINIFEKLKPKKVLIAYPDKQIKESWEKDLTTRGYVGTEIIYTTHLSIKKHVDLQYDIVVIDEIHLLSEAQMSAVFDLMKLNKQILGLTGTLSTWTRKDLLMILNLPVVATYTLDQGVKEGVITDYEITVVKVNLDNVVKQVFKGKPKTEKQQFDSYSYVIDAIERSGRSSMFVRLSRMRLIQGSFAKLNKTKQLLEQYKDERVLVFCGLTKISDSLGIPSYHSKTSEKNLLEDFASGKGNHLAVVKIGNTGVTYKPLNKVIINFFDSNAENLTQKINRCMSMEYSNPDKKAHIYIISSNEEVELNWLRKAIEFFDKSKITVI